MRPLLLRTLGSLLLSLPLACSSADSLCDVPGCEFSTEEWTLIESLSDLPPPPADPSNAYVGNAAAEKLGQRFYFDPAFSGPATNIDMLRRPVPYARASTTSVAGAQFGSAINVSCATCHNPQRAGGDPNFVGGHLGVGAGWYDVNGQQTLNAAYYDVLYWNGRVDSLWAQVVAVNESFVSMNSSRVKNAWIIADAYRTEYEALFGALPLPAVKSSEHASRFGLSIAGATYGQATRNADGTCPEETTEETLVNGSKGCYPRYPLQGKPGNKAGCQRGDTTEPFADAFDCMSAADRTAMTRVHVNFAKAIAAYEYKLISRNSAFDKWVKAGPESQEISPEARRGARLFVGKAGCIDCHNTPFLSDNRFHNVGVPQVGMNVPDVVDCGAGTPCDCVAGTNCLPWGGWDGLKKLKGSPFRRDGTWSDAKDTDKSRQGWYDVELTDSLKGTWRTASLRDVAITPPYMHNGLYRTLQEVVWHYNQGGTSGGFPGQKSVRLKPLYLSDEEQSDLVAFLHTLTGEALPAELTTAPK